MTVPSPSILVIEDDSMMRDALNSLLHAHGYEPRFAPNAELALLDPACEGAACLIVDVALPGLSGIEFVARAGRGDARFGERVIFISAHDSPEMQAEARRLGAKAFLRKPFSGHLLAELVQQVVAADAAHCGPDARAGTGRSGSRN